MITRIEIDGFKSFENFSIDFSPFSAIVGPNASGKSNLFDAIQLVSQLSKKDIRSALLDLRGEPEELFRKSGSGTREKIKISVELLLPPHGMDPFGTKFQVKAQRLRYEVCLSTRKNSFGDISGMFIDSESCQRIKKSADTSNFVRALGKQISYGGNISDFLTTQSDERGGPTFKIRQDGPNKSGKPRIIPAHEASQSALSTIASAEFPHLYAVKNFLSNISFLEINAHNARRESDRFQTKYMLPDASNLSAVLARIKEDTSTEDKPEGNLADISQGLSRLIPPARRVISVTSIDKREYSFEIEMADNNRFSSRVISDGTLRLLSLITCLYDPVRFGLLCFEEPENGVHEGRIGALVEALREATAEVVEDYVQILINTHSPALMASLEDSEVIAADVVSRVIGGRSEKSTRMRREPSPQGTLLKPEDRLTRFEIERLLRSGSDAA
jgi:predicted ATPase